MYRAMNTYMNSISSVSAAVQQCSSVAVQQGQPVLLSFSPASPLLSPLDDVLDVVAELGARHLLR